MALSPMASVVKTTMRQTATVYRYGGADEYGQPIYHEGKAVPCRLAIRTGRTVSDDGDYITNTSVIVLLPADTAIQAMDAIDLPAPYEQGAVITSVTTAADILGRVTHQVVHI